MNNYAKNARRIRRMEKQLQFMNGDRRNLRRLFRVEFRISNAPDLLREFAASNAGRHLPEGSPGEVNRRIRQLILMMTGPQRLGTGMFR